MFDTVIVPLDGTAGVEFAVPFAVDEARLHGARLVLIRVIPRPEPCSMTVRKSGPLAWQGEWPFEDLEPAKREALQYLQAVVTRFALDPTTELRVAIGDPGVQVALEAKRHSSPLVVMTTGDCTRESCPPLSLGASYLKIAGSVPVLGLRPAMSTRPLVSESETKGTRFRQTLPGPALLPSKALAMVTDGGPPIS